MPEVKQCPVCGHDPVICPTWDPAEQEPEATECCGAAFTTVSAWNRYAAAMELAIRYVESVNSHVEERQAHIALGDHPDWLILAQQRVLEVFK